jgi:protein-tyrosine phosphatase
MATPSVSVGESTQGGIHQVPLPDTPGAMWLCGKHVIAPDPEAVLSSVGATTVVCLTRAHEIAERYPDYVTWLTSNQPERAVWLPVADFGVPDDDEVSRRLLVDMAARVRRGEGLIVHCAAGIGRSGTMAAALLVLLGMDADAACSHVRAHRPMAGPEVGAQLALVRRAVSWRAPTDGRS